MCPFASVPGLAIDLSSITTMWILHFLVFPFFLHSPCHASVSLPGQTIRVTDPGTGEDKFCWPSAQSLEPSDYRTYHEQCPEEGVTPVDGLVPMAGILCNHDACWKGFDWPVQMGVCVTTEECEDWDFHLSIEVPPCDVSCSLLLASMQLLLRSLMDFGNLSKLECFDSDIFSLSLSLSLYALRALRIQWFLAEMKRKQNSAITTLPTTTTCWQQFAQPSSWSWLSKWEEEMNRGPCFDNFVLVFFPHW